MPSRMPPVPASITGDVGRYLNEMVRRLNAEPTLSIFSGATPESIVTGIPGNITVNIGSASTNTRVWVLGGSTASQTRTGWHPLRIG